MYTDAGNAQFRLFVQSTESETKKELIIGDTAQYLPTGHVVYAVDNNLFAVPFDPVKLEKGGGPVPMVEGVLRAGGAPQYAVSDSGTLIYMPGTAILQNQRDFVWVDREGKEEPLGTPSDVYYDYFRISPDGTRVALTITVGGNQDIWIWDMVRKTMTRLTFDNAFDGSPIWTLDGKRIIFDSASEGRQSIFWKAADGSGKIEKLASVQDREIWPYPISSNGKSLILGEYGAESGYDIGTLSMEGDHTPKLLLKERYGEYRPHLSPDGRWIAYQSDESGRWEIYVRPFPDVDIGRLQVSTSGGEFPIWSLDGKELFYCSPDSIMAVSVKTKPALKLGTPKSLFPNKYVGQFDVHPDGKRFLMLKPRAAADGKTAEAPRKIVIVLNWLEELKRRVPLK
jgi:serine/threonine-protein kinase